MYWSPDRHRTIDRDEVLAMMPALAAREPKDAYLFYDCQTDDVRLVLTVLGEAERFGAVMLNGAEVTEVLSSDGRAGGVAFVEAESGDRIEVGADNVINATGVWADRLRPEEVLTEEDVPNIAPSRGTHVLIAARTSRPEVRRASSRRVRGVRSSHCPGTAAPSSARPTTTSTGISTTPPRAPRKSATCSMRSMPSLAFPWDSPIWLAHMPGCGR